MKKRKVTGRSILLVALNDLSSPDAKSDGVLKKLRAQAAALAGLGWNVFAVVCNGGRVFIQNGMKAQLLGEYRTNRPYRLKNIIFGYLLKHRFQGGFPSVVYIRGLRISSNYGRFLRLAKEMRAVVCVELPTWQPLLRKRCSFRTFAADILDRIQMFLYRRYIDCFVNFQGYTRMFGKKAIPLDNAISADGIRQKAFRPPDGCIRLIAVASMEAYHGYERILQGLSTYRRTKGSEAVPIQFHLVGEGRQTAFYKDLTRQLGLEDAVFFYGKKAGLELDLLFNVCDLAVGTLGAYKIGLTKMSPLKTKEYCLRGIPFLYAYEEGGLPPGCRFCRLLPNDASEVKMEDVIQFYRESYKNFPELQEAMICHAQTHYSWKTQFQKLFTQPEFQ
jgi:glycosyltransferase involved in cell wall biosynthesis